MNHKNPEDINFQITVGQLTLSSHLPKQDIHVTVAIDDISKMTCSGKHSKNVRTVRWNHPFLFSAPSTASVRIAVWTLPDKLTSKWDKEPLGDQVVINTTSLLKFGSIWLCDITGLPSGTAILSMTCKASKALIISDGHDCLSALQKCSQKLYNFGRWSKNVACITTRIEMDLARLDLCPLGHTNHTAVLRELGISFAIHYSQEGNVADLNRAIDVQQKRLDLCPLGHAEHVHAFGELVQSSIKQYKIQENKEDLSKLIGMGQAWLDLCPLGHSDHAKALGEFALMLWDQYLLQGNITDLNRIVEMEEERFKLCPEGHLDHDTATNNLANCLREKYRKLGNLTDLDRAIRLQEKCLELRPPEHQRHGMALRNLGASHQDRYNRMKNLSDLIMAINLYKKAFQAYPAEHPYFAKNIHSLAIAILLSHNSSSGTYPPHEPHEPLPPSIDDAFEAYGLLKKCGPAISVDLWKATQAWVQDAEKHNHLSVLEAYQTSLKMLDHFTSLNCSLDSRHEMMQAGVAEVADNAFSCATRHGNHEMAVELLEQGRGVLWNQLARFDISIAELDSQDNELGKKFMRLSAELREHAQRSRGHDASPYWRVQEDWQRVVDKIRSLDGFSRFLLPPRFDDLQRAAEYGPVIVVNASKYSCDALIVLRSGAPIHVPLHCSFNDVVQLCSQLLELTQDSHAFGRHRELYVKEILRDLWSSVVEPIVSVLKNDVQLPLGSRIWWCPTSKFTTLPFHAAGPHRKSGKNLMDIYVSSYAPSLSALIRARDRLRSQRETRNASGSLDVISFAAVGQAHPSVDTNMSYLPEVEHEIQRIRTETNMPSQIKFEVITDAAASIEGAVEAFRDHRWVHVACHGAQHATKPFDSWFAMGDGKLTLMRIIQERYTNSEFAFLSACHTAMGDASTPDEVLHLAAGMQFAGFNGVIGTLWRVDDAIAHQVVTRFYKEMFSRPTVDFEYAATALNTAAVATAKEISLEKRIVFVHIGI